MFQKTVRTTFNAGELTPLLDGRASDIEKYGNGCKALENFFVTEHGAAVRRAGTKFVAEVKTSTHRTWLGRFNFNNNESFILEFGDGYVRFFADYGRVVVTSPAYNGATQYTAGNTVLSGGVQYHCKLTPPTAGIAPPNATYWYPMPAGNILEIQSPYPIAALTAANGSFRLRTAQTGDVIYIAHPDYQVYKLSRLGNTAWTLQVVNFTGGPFLDQNTNKAVTVFASARSGSVTLTASSGIFNANLVGAQFILETENYSTILPWEAGKDIVSGATSPLGTIRRSDNKTYTCTDAGAPGGTDVWQTGSIKPTHTFGIVNDGDGQPVVGSTPYVSKRGLPWQFADPGYGYLIITGFTSATQVTATVVGDWILPTTVVSIATSRWAFGAFSQFEGYPSDVTFFRERLVLIKDGSIYFSVAGDFEDFKDRFFGEQQADNAIIVTALSDQENIINWVSSEANLIVGTTSGEFSVKENTTSEAFSPGNIKVEKNSSVGSTGLAPVKIDNSTLFYTRAKRRLYEYKLNGLELYDTTDLNTLADHITRGGVVDARFQQEPYPVIWSVRSDGVLLGLTYNVKQDVIAWHRHIIGGDGIVECVNVIPSPDGSRDDVWLIVRRTINGVTKRYIEYITPEYETGDDVKDRFYLDCSAKYDGVPNDVITGLGYLEGKTVSIMADGAVHPDRVVSGGSITLNSEYSEVTVGLSYRSVLSLNRMDLPMQSGTSQGVIKRISKIIIRFLNTLGGKAGATVDKLDDILFRSPYDIMDAAPPIRSGDLNLQMPSGYETEGYITVVQDAPFPMTVLCIIADVFVGDP